MPHTRHEAEYALADLTVEIARQSAANYAAAQNEPPWAEDTLNRAIWHEYHRLRAESRKRALEGL